MANDGENKSRKRKQQYRPYNRPVKKKGAYPLRPGVEGFFITCDGGRDHQASIEAINIIDSFFDELVNGKDDNPGARQQAPPKVLNKKIKFNFSDSSESEGEEGDEGGKAKKSEVGEEKSEIGDGVKAKTEGNGAKVEEEKPQSVDGVEAKTEDDDGKVEQESEAAGEMESDSGADAEAKTEDNDVKVEPDNSEKEDKEPPVKKQCTGSNGAESGTHAPFQGKTELSIDQQIEAELAQLTDKNKRRFLKLDSGCNGVVFIQMRTKDGEPGPKEVAQRMMETAFSTRKHMARHIMRVLPVEVACYSSEEEISRAIKPLVHKYFSVETETPTKFAVLYDARANSGIDRMKIINAVAKSVPPPHKVDLNNPDKSIIVQIVKTVCLIGVVENFKKFAKYNLRQLTS